MPISDLYRRQAELLVKTIPFVARETCFALKGGTAINLFVRDMPRLSIDIDLTYIPIEDRDVSLGKISKALENPRQTFFLKHTSRSKEWQRRPNQN